MTRSLFLAVLTATAMLALATAGTSQVRQVPGTGCPGASFPRHDPTCRIGATFHVSWGCISSRSAFGALGSTNGPTYSFGPPLTCVAGPCVWYPGPIGGIYYELPYLGSTANWSIPIPNDAGLVGTRWALQCGCWCP